MEKNYDDTFLARWAAGELTPDELKEFKKSTEYSEYEQINEGANRLEAPSYDRQKAFKELRARTMSKPSKKIKRLVPIWTYAAAACAVLLIGYFFTSKTTKFETGTKEQLAISLPDDSEVQLNAASKLTYKPRNWDSARTLKLDGEADFKVKKGSTFEVITNNGTVRVIGTQFVINTRNSFFDVRCYEGKVEVEIASEKFVLEKGNAVRFQEGKTFQYVSSLENAPWLNRESIFNNTPILEVVNELERQFNLEVVNKSVLSKQYFTGSFSHKDASIAIKTIFDAMEIKYTFNGKDSVTLLK